MHRGPRERLHWMKVYGNVSNYLADTFVVDQLSYFAGWLVHQSGSHEDSILAGIFIIVIYANAIAE